MNGEVFVDSLMIMHLFVDIKWILCICLLIYLMI